MNILMALSQLEVTGARSMPPRSASGLTRRGLPGILRLLDTPDQTDSGDRSFGCASTSAASCAASGTSSISIYLILRHCDPACASPIRRAPRAGAAYVACRKLTGTP